MLMSYIMPHYQHLLKNIYYVRLSAAQTKKHSTEKFWFIVLFRFCCLFIRLVVDLQLFLFRSLWTYLLLPAQIATVIFGYPYQLTHFDNEEIPINAAC